ncbi:MAG: hypothetical protein ACTSSA_14015, partial [Candidatus Freyarchaeota archaeon]
MLIAAPRFDQATQYSYKWCVQLAQELGGEQKLLLEKDATRENFEKEIGKHNLFVFYDHGNKDCLVAQDGKENMLDLENVHLVAKKEVYTMACWSARKLGVEAWKRGTVFWGYTEIFGFTTDEEELFCEAANYGLILKVKKGLTWKEALEKAKEKFTELMDRAKDVWTRIWLRHDRDALVCYTEESPPKETNCFVRKASLKLFGTKVGWKLSRLFGWGVLFYLLGLG